MGVVARHNYRTGYLKSEQWQTVRIEVLARDDARCQICGLRSLGNDAHHIEYPENIWKTKADDCDTLCRKCHELVHDSITGKPNKVEYLRLKKTFRDGNLQKIKDEKENEKAKKCVFCQKPHAALLKVELFPDNPKKNSSWSSCLSCAKHVNGMKFFDWKQVRNVQRALINQIVPTESVDLYEI